MKKSENGFVKNLHYLFLAGVIAVGLMTIIATGGGGGGGGGGAELPPPPPLPDIPYTGITDPATIDEDNAEALSVGAFMGYSTASDLPIGAAQSNWNSVGELPLNLRMPQVLKEALHRLDIGLNSGAILNAIDCDHDTLYGDCGGSAYAYLCVDDVSGAFGGYFIYSSYCSEGVTIDGRVDTYGIVDFAGGIDFLKIGLVFEDLTVVSDSDSFTLIGGITYDFISYPYTVSMDMGLRDNSTGKLYWVEDYILSLTEGPGYVDVETFGRYYDPDYGYVTVTTTTPLRFYYGDDWPSQGILVVEGEIGTMGSNTEARLMFLSSTTYQVEADTDGDGSYEWNSGVLSWLAPTVIATTPAANATDVPTDSVITVTFSEAMDPLTINTDTFTVDNGVTATVTYYDTTATFTPSMSLDPDITYTVTITTGVKDTGGNPMSFPYSWSFTTSPFEGYSFNFPINDAGFNSSGTFAYFTSKNNKKVYFIDIATGEIETEFTFSYMPESIAIRPDSTTMYVALLTMEHSSGWGSEDQEGYIAEFDLGSRSKLKEFKIDIDPFDLVASSDGYLYVTSGSGQWTYLDGYNVSTELRTGRASIRQLSHIKLHPSEGCVYTADTDLIPSDIEKFSISVGDVTSLWDSPYHGHHRMSGNVYIDPAGAFLITRGGDLFTSSPTQSEDMVYIQGLSQGTIHDVAFDLGSGHIFTVEADGIRYYDYATYSLEGAIYLTAGDKNFISFNNDYSQIYYVKGDDISTKFYFIDNPATE